jgi:hypothetical protein
MSVMMADHSGLNMQDSDIPGFLELLPFGSSVDLRFNRLTHSSIAPLVRHLQNDADARFVVNGNSFGFDIFYEVLQDMGEVDLIRARRLNMSSTDSEWRIEKLALTAKEGDRIIQFEDIIEKTVRLLDKGSLQMIAGDAANRLAIAEILSAGVLTDKRINDVLSAGILTDNRINDVSEQMRKLQSSVVSLTKWHLNQTSLFESVITNSFAKYLISHGYTDVTILTDKNQRCAPQMTSLRKDSSASRRDADRRQTNAFEWDGVICCDHLGERKLFLIEAKTTVAIYSISDMEGRIDKTKKFIEDCGSFEDHGMSQKKPVKKEANRVLRAIWGAFSDCSIEAVIASTVFTEEHLSAISNKKYFGMCINEESYHVIHGGEESPLFQIDEADIQN